MSQQKDNMMSAQASSEINAEAAIKLFPLNSKSNIGSQPTDKDGYEGPPPEILQFLVEVCNNGFMVTITYDDMDTPDDRYICSTIDEVTELIKGTF